MLEKSPHHVQAHLRNRVEAELGLPPLDVLPVCHLHLNDLVDLLHLEFGIIGIGQMIMKVHLELRMVFGEMIKGPPSHRRGTAS